LSASNSDWQTRAEEAERLVAELKSAVAHAQGDLFAAQLRVAAMETEADKREASYRELAEGMAAQEDRDEAACLRVGIPPHGCDTSDMLADEVLALRATLARVREVAERHAVLDVSNGSWKAAARDVAGKILRALEGGK
jgi:hypothetical protein